MFMTHDGVPEDFDHQKFLADCTPSELEQTNQMLTVAKALHDFLQTQPAFKRELAVELIGEIALSPAASIEGALAEVATARASRPAA